MSKLISTLMTVFFVVAAAIMLVNILKPVEPTNFTGYLVAKEYVPAHMSNQTVAPVRAAGVVIVPHPIHVHRTPPKPHRISAKWYWYVANKYEVVELQVDSARFNTHLCGEVVTILKP